MIGMRPRHKIGVGTHKIKHNTMAKAKFKYLLGRRKGSSSVELYINFGGGRRTYITTKLKLPQSAWDEYSQTVRPNYPAADKINLYLQNFRRRYEEIELDCMNKDTPFTPETLGKALNGQAVDDGSLVDYMRGLIETEISRDKYADGTAKHLRSFCNKLEDFERESARKITFRTLDRDMLADIDIFYKRLYTSWETVRKQFVYFKKYVTMAVREGKMLKNPFDDFKIERPKEKKQEGRDALGMGEIRRLEQMAENGALDPITQLALDRFLLSVYTGLRISDNGDLRRTDIKYDDTDGGLIIDRITKKTGVRVILPLRHLFGGKPEKIVQKYLALNVFGSDDRVFPPLSDQKTNLKLKYIAAWAQIRNLGLTFHIARHTCATLLAEKTGNPYTIMQILGHSNIEEAMSYIHSSRATIVNSLAGVDWQ